MNGNKKREENPELSNIARYILEYFHDKGEKVEVHKSIKVEAFNIVIQKIFPDRVLSYDSECVDSVSIYENLLYEHAGITKGEWLVSKVELLDANERDNCGYDEVVLRFDSSNGVNEWLISEVDSDYVSDSFYKNLFTYAKQNLSGEFKMIPTYDQGISIIYLSPSLSKIYNELLKSKGLVRELCETGQSDYLLWQHDDIGENEADICSHFGYEYQVSQDNFYVTDNDRNAKESETEDESNNLNQKLLESVKAGDTSEVRRIVGKGADINFDSAKALTLAAGENNLKMVKLLILLGADTSLKFGPLNYAAVRHKNYEMATTLLNAGANPNSRYYSASTLTHVCNLNKKEDNDWKPYPITDNAFEIAKILLDAGASPDGKRGDDPECPLFKPILADDFRTVKLLIDYGAKLSVMPVLAAANWCAHVGRHDMLELLLQNGFNPNPRKAKDKLPASPLHYAIASGHKDIVELLIQYKINVNYIPNYYKLSVELQHLIYRSHPLVVAIEKKHTEITRLLLDNGADPREASKKGYNVTEILKSQGVAE